MSDVLAAFDFETPRLRMRPMRECDQALFCDLYTDAETMRFVAPSLKLAKAINRFAEALRMMHGHPIEWLFLVMTQKSSAQTIGLCGVPGFDLNARRLELGMMLRREVRGKGYSKEGLAALADRTFSVLPVDKLWVEYSPEHIAADRLTKGIGFLPNPEAVATRTDACVWSVWREPWYSARR
jgi:RimJ/RimL family protein N-acetyltransferase